MKLTHLELPRHFTFTVKEYQIDAARAVAHAGHAYEQAAAWSRHPPLA